VRHDIAAALRLRPGFALHLGSFDRPNLWLGVVPVKSERDRLNALLQLLRGDDAMAIVYAPTRSTTESVARALMDAGHRAAPYHAGLTKRRRAATLEDFLQDRVDVVVATSAFGMGIDKPNVRLVVHWTAPPTPEAYYQEAGRAGRDGEFSRCVLLYRTADTNLHRRQLDVTFPQRRLLERVWSGPAGRVGVPHNVLASAERLRRELRPERGPIDWRPVVERRRRAEERIEAVEKYGRGPGCRRAQLVGYFGERLAQCAGCDRCGRRGVVLPPDLAVATRLRRLIQSLAGHKTLWAGCPLEPDVLLRLSRLPPRDAAELAEVPGVGAAIAERLGGSILRALAPAAAHLGQVEPDPILRSLEDWRTDVAKTMGVPPYAVCSDAVLRTVAKERPRSRLELASICGIGPRALAKFGDDLVRLSAPDSECQAPLRPSLARAAPTG
jgi:ATP-dependent DNA helicase RecQ